jgi:hypothetical protein
MGSPNDILEQYDKLSTTIHSLYWDYVYSWQRALAEHEDDLPPELWKELVDTTKAVMSVANEQFVEYMNEVFTKLNRYVQQNDTNVQL